MNVEPSIIYGLVAALAAAVAALWRVQFDDHRICRKNLQMLTEHTIAQQHDIREFMEDRIRRGLHPLDLASEKTAFYRKHCEPGGEGEAEI